MITIRHDYHWRISQAENQRADASESGGLSAFALSTRRYHHRRLWTHAATLYHPTNLSPSIKKKEEESTGRTLLASKQTARGLPHGSLDSRLAKGYGASKWYSSPTLEYKTGAGQ